jgi:hypothetical protein
MDPTASTPDARATSFLRAVVISLPAARAALFPTSASLIAVIVVGVTLSAVGFVPLFGGPGYEHALASGVVLPAAAAIATALEVARSSRLSPVAALGRGTQHGITFSFVALATAFAHALRVGACDLTGGSLHFALTAGVGAVLGGAWGAIAGELARNRARVRVPCALLALAAPVFGILVSVMRFYGSPMIFAFDPFFGYFSGTLYDTVIDAGPALLTYRLGSCATLSGAFLVASSFDRSPLRVALRVPLSGGGGARLVLGILLLAASLVVAVNGPALGHWQTSASIARELGGQLQGSRCTVVFPSGQRPDEARLLLGDCEQELARVERVLGARGPSRVTAFFFRDAAEKRRLMGAESTLIAKPWRAEVYVQLASYPHPVLGHEIAHVIAGSFGRGPFRVSGALHGLLPNPGLIEGIAVAASPDDDELTGMQWARAMRDIGILPPLAQVFSLEFLGAHASKSYTVAGAFVSYVLDKYGAAAVRAWYGGEALERATGKTLAVHEAEFHAYLDAQTLPEQARAYARAKFERKGVFARRCPHAVDALRREADGCRDARQAERAVALYEKVLARDATDYAALYGRALTRAREAGDEAALGIAELGELSTRSGVPTTWRDRADETLADLETIDTRDEDSSAAQIPSSIAGHYRSIAARTVDEDAARTLDVKAIAVETPEGRIAIRALLLGTKDHPPDTALAFLRLGAWSSRASTSSFIADYLLGKNLVLRGFYEDARPLLDRALAASIGASRVARETLRQRVVVACVLGEREILGELKARLVSTESPFAASAGGRRESVAAHLERCLETPISSLRQN